MKKIITSENISVVVRGLIVGAGETDPEKKFTKRSLESIRQYLPGAEIILSTWKGSDVSGLDYDVLVENEEPVKINMINGDGVIKFIATNNQIVTSREGLKKATRPYIINMRSDLVLTGKNGFIDYFERYNRENGSCKEILKNKIVVLPTYNPKKSPPFLFDTCDWFYFGNTEDVRKIFDIPLMVEKNLRGEKIKDYYQINDNLESEQYIWSTFLEKNGFVTHLTHLNQMNDELLVLSENSYGCYTIMAPAQKVGVICLKMPHAGYGARPWQSQGLYTFNEYKKMYNAQHAHKVWIFPHPVETVLYACNLSLRGWIRKISPDNYRKIVNFMRKRNGSYNLLK